jgi:hypothetical protein
MGGALLGIEWFRDLFICLFAVVATIVSIFITVLLYRIYHRASKIMDSVKDTAKTVQGISSYTGDQVIRPLVEIAAIIQGVRQGIETISKLFRKREGDEND